MEHYEIERKYLVKKIPDLSQYPFHIIEQAYLCTSPVVRVRRKDENYYITYKGQGFAIREEYNLPLSEEAYHHLIAKADGNIISKTRYLIPDADGKHTIELDIFAAPFAPLVLAEVEFDSAEEMQAYHAPDWFGEDVTEDRAYANSTLSQKVF